MPAFAKCACGAIIKAKSELAGRTVSCPSCGQPVVIPPAPIIGAIGVTCTCGQALRAKTEMAEKRVKCPSCGQAISIPTPEAKVMESGTPVAAVDAENDPLGLGDLASDPLLGGTREDDPLGVTPAQRLPSRALTSSFLPRVEAAQKVRGKSTSPLVTAAGSVAAVFGAYPGILHAVTLLWSLSLVASSGALLGIMSFSTVIHVLFLALGVWLAKSGVDILRGVSPRESLERAAQVSMVYLALAILGLLLAIFAILRHPSLILAVLLGTIQTVVHLFPPGFVLYVDKTIRTE